MAAAAIPLGISFWLPIDLASIKTENSESSALLENFKFVQNSHKLTEQLKQIKKLKLLLTIKTIRAIIIFVPREQQRTSKKFEKINKKVVDKQNNIWYTKRVAAETDNNKEPWKSKIEQYVKPWKFE